MFSERLSYHLLTPADFSEVLEMFAEPNTFKYISPLANLTKQQYVDFLNLKLQEIATEKGFYFLVRDLQMKQFLGVINLTPISNTEKIQIGWQFKKEFHRKGYASEASQRVLKYAEDHTDFSPIYSVFVKGNAASHKILEKLNFSLEEEYTKNGETLMRYIYHISRKE